MIDRRTLLAAAGALMLPKTVPGANRSSLDRPGGLLEAYLRLGASLDDRLVIWWMDGLRYGVVDARARLLFGMKVGMFHRYFRQSDGSARLAMFELTYYTDLATGELLETFDNPYTGETNRVRHVRLGPEIRHQTSAGLVVDESPLIRDYHSSLGPALVSGDELWIPGGVEAVIAFPKPDAPDIRLNHYTTVHGSVTEALDETRASVPATLAFQNVIKWEPWMAMHGQPGHMMSRAAGRKLASVDALPEDYLRIARRLHPAYIADPVGKLDKMVARIRSTSP